MLARLSIACLGELQPPLKADPNLKNEMHDTIIESSHFDVLDIVPSQHSLIQSCKVLTKVETGDPMRTLNVRQNIIHSLSLGGM